MEVKILTKLGLSDNDDRKKYRGNRKTHLNRESHESRGQRPFGFRKSNERQRKKNTCSAATAQKRKATRHRAPHEKKKKVSHDTDNVKGRKVQERRIKPNDRNEPRSPGMNI